MKREAGIARLSFLAAALAGCDAAYSGFLDAVPIPDDTGDGPIDVYLAIDGLSRAAYDRARALGAFGSFADGDLITAFPGTSDYAWTRMLGAPPLAGYEIQYFDPERNRIENQGLKGVVEHPVREGLADSFPCYARFDFLGDGYLWMARGYQDPEAALPRTLDELFAVLVRRSRRQRVFLAYLLNVDVIGHKGGLDRAAAALVEIDRRIAAFNARHPGRYRFTLFGDHGNAHQRARLVDPTRLLAESGVMPTQSLSPTPVLQAVPIVHVRVSYVALHTRPQMADLVAERTSRHPDVDLAVAALPAVRLPDGEIAPRFGIWQRGEPLFFSRRADGRLQVEEPRRWSRLGIELPATDERAIELRDDEAFALTAGQRYPDLFYRVATAFEHPAARFRAEVILSFPDDVASYGFHVPGSGDGVAIDGFHGGLARGATVSVLASQAFVPPAAVRADDLLRMLPLAPKDGR
jgi:hypothetical protein